MKQPRIAHLYRMVMDDHVCPYGIKSKWLLKRRGFEVEDHHLTTRAETDAFKKRHRVKTTPQTFIGESRIGGYTDLATHLGKPVTRGGPNYRPVLALFALMALMALGAAFHVTGMVISVLTAEWFISFSMVSLAYLKLRDVESFSTMFLNYDLLARHWVPYAYIYPFAEGAAGLLMTAHVLDVISVPLALVIGTIGAVSVIKAVYIDRRELKCACVGGDSNVPLGFVSLTENLLMIAMGFWMVAKPGM